MEEREGREERKREISKIEWIGQREFQRVKNPWHRGILNLALLLLLFLLLEHGALPAAFIRLLLLKA